METCKQLVVSVSKVSMGGTEEAVITYTHNKERSGRPVNSDSFNQKQYINPKNIEVQPPRWRADSLSVGECTLSQAVRIADIRQPGHFAVIIATGRLF